MITGAGLERLAVIIRILCPNILRVLKVHIEGGFVNGAS